MDPVTEGRLDTSRAELETSVALCRLFAQDSSEKAGIAAVNALKVFFGAAGAALFYVNGRREHRLCLDGSEFPISLGEKKWREAVVRAHENSRVARFGPWALPGLDEVLTHWISAELSSSKTDIGCVLLGRSTAPWSDEEVLALGAIADTIAPIVEVRIEREREDFVRHQAELLLAESERRLRGFFEGSRDMIYTANSEDVVTSVNAAGLGLTGRSQKSQILGHPFCDLALNKADRDFFLRRIREEGYVVDYEILLERSDGSRVFCLETAHTLRGPKGEIVEVQGIIKDLSERIKNEGELWKANLELAEANLLLQQTQGLMVQQEKLASIGQLAAGIAHEINNPVGFLKSNHAILEKHVSKIREAWAAAGASCGGAIAEIEKRMDLAYVFSEFDTIFSESAEGFARIMRIVGNLKNFSRIDMGTAMELYDVNEGLESTLIVAQNEIKYLADTRASLGDLPSIRAKGGEINQVFLNILVNAAQAIETRKEKGKGLIEIETRRIGEQVLIIIRDNGPGIPEAIRTRIFDPFFTTKDPGKGTGLGLSISYDIIERKHKGKLYVESEPGRGSAFFIELPIAGPSPQ